MIRHHHQSFNFHRGTGTNTQEINRIEIPVSWKTMEEYQTDDEFHWINPKQVNSSDDTLWRTVTLPAEIEFFLLKQNQLHFGQSEYKKTPFTTPEMSSELGSVT